MTTFQNQKEQHPPIIFHKNPLIRGVLIDLSGTVHLGNQLLPGAANAIQRLRDSGRKVRFLTNTSTQSTSSLLQQLQSFPDNGGTISILQNPNELITSVLATKRYLLQHKNLRPYCLMEDTSDFLPEMKDVLLQGEEEEVNSTSKNCVVIGLAPSKFHYDSMNMAFRILHQSTEPNKLIAIHKAPIIRTSGKNDKQQQQQQKDEGTSSSSSSSSLFSMGPGGFCAALEYAVSCEAIVMGKPSKAFFESALWDDIPREETCMIGDDVLQDIQGAYHAGIGTRLLVQTGKYQANAEDKVSPGTITSVCASLVEAVDYILNQG